MDKRDIRRIKRFIGGFFTITLAVVFLLVWGTPSNAASYPAKSITIISPFPPGGGNDIVCRALSVKLSSILGQSVVVSNKAGGGGAIGIQSVKVAAPDGYTILSTPPPIVMLPLTTKGINFSHKDFIPLNIAVSAPSVLVVKSDAPWKELEDVIAEAKKKPGKLSYASTGFGGTPFFAGEFFKMVTETEITHVPMNGIAPAMSALLGGHVTLAFPESGAVLGHLQSGTVRALVVMAKKRLKDFPNVPTTAEKGYPKLITTSWHGFFLPSNTPAPVVKKLADAFHQALTDKEVVASLEKLGWVIENIGPAEAAKFLMDEDKKWSEVARASKAVAQ
jgi:tripartite-type tricarboxylate transporter receptor subunit TctC